jgi:hypothetical protein
MHMTPAQQVELFADDDTPNDTTTDTARVLYRCGVCEHRTKRPTLWRLTFRRRTEQRHGRQQQLWTSPDGGTHHGPDAPPAACHQCQRTTPGRIIRGTFSAAHRCDARCIYAKGPDCECACAGANHGAGHSR